MIKLREGELQLPDVTLLIYDAKAPRLAAIAVEDTLAKASFGEVQVWSEVDMQPLIKADVDWFQVPRGLGKIEGQSYLWNEIPKSLSSRTSHVLNIEWDSGISDPALWEPGFLDYDYVGAPWPFHSELRVGNGGFALMSTRLMQFLAANTDDFPYAFPWDDTLCRRHRVRLEERGFVWAPDDVAERFAYEYGPLRPAFGFHDSRNFPAFLPYADLARRMEAANDYVRGHAAWKVMVEEVRGLSRNMEVTPLGAENRPVHPAIDGLNRLAVAQAEGQMFDAAVVTTQRAIHIMPTAPDLWANLASHYWHLRKYVDAWECAERALRSDPNNTNAWGNLALALESMRDVEGAEAAYRTGLQRNPDAVKLRYNYGLMLLGQGRYEEGWQNYEARIAKSPENYPKFVAPYWDGEDLTDRTIFVFAEQGIGDNVLFARFLPWLAERAARIYVCWPGIVHSLLSGYMDDPRIAYCPEGTPIPKTDYSMFMGSLPYRAGATIDHLPPDPGFISERVKGVGEMVQVPYPAGLSVKPFRVGICWTGNPKQERNRDRTVPLELLIGLAADPRVFLYSLQCGPGQADLNRVGVGDLVVDPSTELTRAGLAATGSAMTQLDLVITCCTSIAHLAGALGLPAWVMLPRDPYWVWGESDDESTPWWPSLRLFRQEEPFKWEPVVDHVKDEVTKLIDGVTPVALAAE
jgi:hypothetical protein